MSANPLVLLAAGGLAREVLSTLAASADRTVIGLLDDDVELHGTSVAGLPVLGGLATAADYPTAEFLTCAGRGAARSEIVNRLSRYGIGDGRYATVIDPSARVSANCTVGEGSILLANSVLTADVAVGRHVVTMPNVVLTHDDRIGDFATLCAGVVLGGGTSVGDRAYLGMNAAVRNGVRIGAGATIGMGSVVLSDVPYGECWVGVPARELTKDTNRGVA